MRVLVFLSGIILASFIFGCKPTDSEDKGEVVATYKDKTLFREEVDFFIPDHLKKEDSTIYAQQFIGEWIRSQAIMEQASATLPHVLKKVNYQVDENRRELVAHRFMENLTLSPTFDTVVATSEMINYYNRHPDKFISQTKYYSFFHVRTDDQNPYRQVTLMKSRDKEKLSELMEWCETEAVEYKLDSSYTTATELERISKGAYINLLRTRPGVVYNYFTIIDETKRYNFFKQLDVIKEGDMLPLRMCIPKIKSIILSQRKNRLIEQSATDLVQKAKAAGKYTIY